MKHEYNITVEDIIKMAGGARDKAAARARKAFAKNVANTELIVEPQVLRDRCKELVGVAPGWEALVELTNKVKAGLNPIVPAKKQDEIQALKNEVNEIRKKVDDLIQIIMEHVTKPSQTLTAVKQEDNIKV